MERNSSSAWVRGIVEMFAAEGVDSAWLFGAADLDIARLHDPDGRFSIDEVSLLWELAVARSGKLTLGLSKALAVTHGNLGLVRYAMMSCPTLLAALQRLARYMDVISNAATFALSEEAEGCWIELGQMGVHSRPVPRQRVEFGMLTLLCSFGWFTGRDVTPLVVEFMDPAPADAGAHLEAFGCPVRFGQLANRALLRKSDLALPLSARDDAMAALHARLVDDELERLDGAHTSQQVRRILSSQVPFVELRREQLAAALHISERTLQRRLHAEGTSFHDLLDDTRRELAQQHLRSRRLSLKQVAQLLGFEEQSTFFRACRRWFGEPPGLHRIRLLGQPVRTGAESLGIGSPAA